jgi:hypothetical protein
VTDSTAEEVVTMEVTGQGRVLWRTRVPGPARHISISSDGGTIWTALGTAAPGSPSSTFATQRDPSSFARSRLRFLPTTSCSGRTAARPG